MAHGPFRLLADPPLARLLADPPLAQLLADPAFARRRKIPVKDAAALNDLSEATFRRRYPHLIRQVSARRQAVELGDAIDLPPPPPE